MFPEGDRMAAAQKLSQLLGLADQGPALRAALAEEVAGLLTHWPANYPQSMREACEALLSRTARDMDFASRARLRAQLYSVPELAARILPRENLDQILIEAARVGEHLLAALAQSLGVDGTMAAQILDDESGAALVVACKGANIERAAFSALTLLARPGRDRAQTRAMLEAYDSVPTSEAIRVLQGWRSQKPVTCACA